METNKPYHITMEDRGDYLYVLVGGDQLTALIAGSYWNEIAGKCFELEKMKILIEKNFKESVGPAEMIQMSSHLGKLLATRRIAFLDRWGHDEINSLGKKLARNRDVMMQVFENVNDAERWLLAN
jgi:hypothetical protein